MALFIQEDGLLEKLPYRIVSNLRAIIRDASTSEGVVSF